MLLGVIRVGLVLPVQLVGAGACLVFGVRLGDHRFGSVVPPDFDDILLLDRVKELLAPAGFGRISVITAQDHDRRIAFTSQLAHVVSNAYIKSPTARSHDGFSAGSYRDLTRVAWLNPDMWSELCLENQTNILNELDLFIANLQEYRTAIANNDFPALRELFNDGKIRKELIDG